MTFVRDELGVLPCCWDDCEKPGLNEIKARTVEPASIDLQGGVYRYPRTTWYVFCSERHKMLWVNSSRSNGNLPTGSKGLAP